MASPDLPRSRPRHGQSWAFVVLFVTSYGLMILHAWAYRPEQGWTATLSGALAALGCVAIIRDVKYPFLLRSILCVVICFLWSCSCLVSVWTPGPCPPGVFSDLQQLNGN